MVRNIYKEIIEGNLEYSNLKMGDLSILTDTSEKHLYEIMSGKTTPSYELTLKIENAFNIPKNTIYNAASRKDELSSILKDKEIDSIFEVVSASPEYKLTAIETIKTKIANLFKGNLDVFKKYLKANSVDFFKYKDKPLAYYWIAIMDEKHGHEKSSGSFKKSIGQTVIKNVLDRFYESDKDIYKRIESVVEYLDAKGIILRNSPFIQNSTINGCVLKKNKQYFIFMNDNRKREYQYIFALIHELMHIFMDKKDDNNSDVASLIKEYEQKYNKKHKEINMAIEAFTTKDWESLYKNTKLKLSF